jgi:D-alanyl-D-alanine carboxypeptidase
VDIVEERLAATDPVTEPIPARAGLPPRGPGRPGPARRRLVVAGLVVLAAVAGAIAFLRSGPPEPVDPASIRGSSAWALKYYGDPEATSFERRSIVEIEFLGRAMFVHKEAKRHFLRLERLFEARAPDYASGVASGELDDWSYLNRDIRGGGGKSNHAFGLAVDVNALSNPLGTPGDMPAEVVQGWKAEGGEWGGDWSRPDPMHFETHLTPEEIRKRYKRDGTPRPWFLEELIGAAAP